MSITACSDPSFAFGTGGRTHPAPHGGRHEVTTRVSPFVRTSARRRRDCRGPYERGSGPPLFFCFIPVCSDSIPCALRAGERGLESPPLPRAEALCSLPACSDPSFAFGTGGRIHPSPHGGGGMKSGQGCYPLCVPRPAVGGIAGVRARPENPPPPAGRYGGKGENEAFSLVAPPCDPVSASPSVPKAKLLLEHEDVGRTGRRSTLKGKGDSGGGCKEGAGGNYRRNRAKRKNA